MGDRALAGRARASMVIGLGFPGDLEGPRLEHRGLRIEPRDEDLQRAWSAFANRVAVTHPTYATMLAPPDHSARRSEEARRDDVAEQIRDDAQLLLDAQEPSKDLS